MTCAYWLGRHLKQRTNLQTGSMLPEQISPYATAYRYPGEVLEPDLDEFNQAFQAASKFYDFICSMLPPEVSASK